MMMKAIKDGNHEKYETKEVVSFYEKQTGLEPCEIYLFERHIKPGMSILDMGVGGGRTTPFLARNAARYIGADYSQGMVEVCRRRFPDLEFRHCDATHMAQFQDQEFDLVVFSFNGIDVIPSDEGRKDCLMETARVLKPGGLFIFSSHNAQVLAVWPQLADARGYQILWRIIRSILKSSKLAFNNIRSDSYREGQGYILDPVHGGMKHYVSIPETMRPQLEEAGMQMIETVGGRFPGVKSHLLTPWYYHACRKAGNA